MSEARPQWPDPLAFLGPLAEGIDGIEQLERVRRGTHVHQATPRPPVGLTPHQVIHRQDKLALRYYAPSGEQAALPVVLVPSLINRAWILDLEPERSLVRGLSEQGHATYLVDWGVPGPEDADEDVGYVLEELLHRAVRRACRHAGTQQAIVFGYCMGGTLAAMYTALHPERVAGLACLATPVDFDKGGRFRDFVDAHIFEPAALDRGLVPVDLMKPAFKLLDPMGHWNKFIALDHAAANPRTLHRALVRERWLEENVPVSGAFAREFIERAYQHNALVNGGWQLRGRDVALQHITCPVLVTPCARDFIAPTEACLPLAELVGSDDITVEVLQAGHIGAVVGGYGPKVYYPLLDQWFRGVAA